MSFSKYLGLNRYFKLHQLIQLLNRPMWENLYFEINTYLLRYNISKLLEAGSSGQTTQSTILGVPRQSMVTATLNVHCQHVKTTQKLMMQLLKKTKF